jgi:HSP20 family protein
MNTANNSFRSGRRLGTLLDPRRLFDDLMTWEPVGSEVVWSAFSAPLDVDNTNDGVTISIDMPGVEASDLDLTFEAGTLAIAGKRGDRTYSYSVALDDTIDPSTIDAKLDKGVLVLQALKRPEAKPRKIVVNAESNHRLGVGVTK